MNDTGTAAPRATRRIFDEHDAAVSAALSGGVLSYAGEVAYEDLSADDTAWELDPVIRTDVGTREVLDPLKGLTPDPAEGKSRDELKKAGRMFDFPQPDTRIIVMHIAPVEDHTQAVWPLLRALWEIPPADRRSVLRARSVHAVRERKAEWSTAHGNVVLMDGKKSYTGTCDHCSDAFVVVRGASRNGRWSKFCSDVCLKASRAERERVRYAAAS